MRRGWYIFEDGRTQGPVTARELLYRAETAQLKPDALVWRPGFSEWRLAHEVDGLYKPPPIPSNAKAKMVRASRMSHPTEFVRTSTPPLKSMEQRDDSESGYHRSPTKSRQGKNGRAEAGPSDIENAATFDSPKPNQFSFRAHRTAKRVYDATQKEDRHPRPLRKGLVERIAALGQPV